ncbi:MAG: triose-phosphate isomerase [Dehalococcoidia bacterium]|nr:triose-phosphate isomerase [Dehalococcoidia bacterium]
MRTPIIAGNWKMNTTLPEARELVGAMLADLGRISGVEKVLCPPFISLAAIADLVKGTSVGIGAQNMHFQEKGAFTGEVSPVMLSPLCQYVILGHSERRQYFGETDEIVNKKVEAALKVGLRPIMCVGERLEENEAGRTEEVVGRQVRGGLAAIPRPESLIIAYEPVWAIGTGRAATAGQANQTIGFIRQVVAELYGDGFAEDLRIQYGGSVTAQNAAELMREPEIDGALVGGASLKAQDFVSIVAQAAGAKSGGRA